MHEIWEALQLDGIEMSYGQFRTYIWRIRKRLRADPEATHRPEPRESPATREPLKSAAQASGPAPAESARDPLANIRREQERKRSAGFTYDPIVPRDDA